MAIFVPCFFFFYLLLTVSCAAAATDCDACLRQSKAAYFHSSSPISWACGYGYLAKDLYEGYTAAGVPSLFKDGVGCGTCFLVKCKDKKLCRGRGTKVVLTNNYKSDSGIDLVLSDRAFISMAYKDKAREMLDRRIIDIEYKRIPCEYTNQNLSVRVEASSKKPDSLAVAFLYQGGQTEIVAVSVIDQFGRSRPMVRIYGTVWDMSPVPEGPLSFSLLVAQGFDGSMAASEKDLPADWKVGEIYDLGVQMNGIIDYRDGCSGC
ncbi:expansin-like A2 isoform X2 [Papaver somniferum]|uniref:expansin-like A2 isoform X2 n=1 Tax=Papaver somniferum TaxID=3469 RepID=UPI000E705886|nr:expansin-like A2 isoform X2 [Papaver somniferum]